MKSLKRTILGSLSLIMMLALITSCKKDSCTPPDVSQNIIGTFIAKNTTNEIEFKTDGTYVDDNEYLAGVTVNGVNYSDRTYTITSDSLKVTVSDPGGSGSTTVGYSIEANKCEEIVISTTIGISITTTLEKQ